MTKIMLYRHFVGMDNSGDWWCELDTEKDRLTGRWRIEENGDMVIEVAHGYWTGVFKRKWIEVKDWYESDKVKFVEEFGGCDQ